MYNVKVTPDEGSMKLKLNVDLGVGRPKAVLDIDFGHTDRAEIDFGALTERVISALLQTEGVAVPDRARDVEANEQPKAGPWPQARTTAQFTKLVREWETENAEQDE